MHCGEEWNAPFWGGEPGVLEHHTCVEYEDHYGRCRCDCGETADQQDGDQS